MKEIPLTQGKVAIVDDQDYPALSRHTWQAGKWRRKTRLIWYAIRNGYNAQHRRVTVFMHVQIFGGLKGLDHKDGDGLNNRRENLRRATPQQNCFNRRKQAGCSSRFKGVTWYPRYRKWMASIKIAGHQKNLGYFVSEEAAAKAYDQLARKAFGEFALTNLPS